MNKLTAILVLVLLALSLRTGPAIAQDAQPEPPDRPRFTITLPPGFELVEAGGVKAICEPADRKLVEETLSSLEPATRPTTTPADLLTRFGAARQDVVKQIAAEYAIADSAPLLPHLDRAAAELERLDQFKPPLFYLCTTDTRLKELLKSNAWTSPSIYYNRLADQVMYRETVPLTLERPMDDAIIAVIIEAGQTPEQLQAKLRKLVQSTTSEVARMISGRSMFLVQATFIDAVMLEVFDPLKLAVDQQWLGIGLSGVTSADYAEKIIGSPKRELLLLIAAELRRNPIRMNTIDLLKPTEGSSLKRQFVAPYADAYRRKSMGVAKTILDHNRDKLPALMASLREKPCASGEELLARIQQITEVDVSAAARAQ